MIITSLQFFKVVLNLYTCILIVNKKRVLFVDSFEKLKFISDEVWNDDEFVKKQGENGRVSKIHFLMHNFFRLIFFKKKNHCFKFFFFFFLNNKNTRIHILFYTHITHTQIDKVTLSFFMFGVVAFPPKLKLNIFIIYIL